LAEVAGAEADFLFMATSNTAINDEKSCIWMMDYRCEWIIVDVNKGATVENCMHGVKPWMELA
jgi:hypothetical protein